MRRVDFLILMICCMGWAGNFVMSAWALGNNPVPPFMLAAVRAFIVLIIMSPFLLRTRPERFGRLLVVCACVGPIHLAFIYTGLQTAPASGSSIVSQMLIPFATILSVIFLKEKIGWIRGLGILGAFLGVMVMIYEPEALALDVGLVYVGLAYLSMAVGSVVIKGVGDVDWRQYVAWMAFLVLTSMSMASALFETGHGQVWREAKWPLLIAASYAAIAVSVIAHGQYFDLIKRYDVSLIVPLTLVVPLFACVMGVIFLHEPIFLRYYVGAALIMPCVYIIARRQKS